MEVAMALYRTAKPAPPGGLLGCYTLIPVFVMRYPNRQTQPGYMLDFKDIKNYRSKSDENRYWGNRHIYTSSCRKTLDSIFDSLI